MPSGAQTLNFQDFSTFQSEQQPKPVTRASAASVSPTGFLTFFTGTVQLATIVPPIPGCHALVFVFTNGAPGAFLTTGNIQRAAQPVQNVPILLVYDPVSNKYWVGSVSAVV